MSSQTASPIPSSASTSTVRNASPSGHKNGLEDAERQSTDASPLLNTGHSEPDLGHGSEVGPSAGFWSCVSLAHPLTHSTTFVARTDKLGQNATSGAVQKKNIALFPSQQTNEREVSLRLGNPGNPGHTLHSQRRTSTRTRTFEKASLFVLTTVVDVVDGSYGVKRGPTTHRDEITRETEFIVSLSDKGPLPFFLFFVASPLSNYFLSFCRGCLPYLDHQSGQHYPRHRHACDGMLFLVCTFGRLQCCVLVHISKCTIGHSIRSTRC